MVEAQWSKIERALDTLETRWVDQMNAPLNIGQIACIAALGYLDFRLGDRDWRAERPVLAAWFGDLADRPSVAATMPFAP